MPAERERSTIIDTPFRALIERQSQSLGEAPYVLDARSERRVSYAQLEAHVKAWDHATTLWNMAPGDRVGLLVTDPIDFTLCFLALLAQGLWVAPMDPTTYVNGPQLTKRIANLRLRGVLSDRPAPFETGVDWHQLSVLLRNSGHQNLSPRVAGTNESGGVILASSGTTGTPKIMALRAAQLLLTAEQVALHNALEHADRGLNALPLWHINAEVVGLLATLVAGASLSLEDRFHRTDFWAVADKCQITWINAVPAIISRLSTLQEGEIVPSRIRFIRSASAPLSPALLGQFEKNIGIPVIESYGMTEAASQISANPLSGPRKVGSVGRAVGVAVRVVTIATAAPGQLAATNEIGTVEIKGPSVIERYEGAGYEDRFDHDDWLDTGDLGYLDDDSFLFLVGRSDDVINRGGEKIFPREIEDVILGVRGVVGAAVIGVADDVFGQVPISYVQLDGISSSTPVEELRIATKEIYDALVAAFSRARRPVNINVVAQLPAHATGKIQKKDLGTGDVPVLFQVHVL